MTNTSQYTGDVEQEPSAFLIISRQGMKDRTESLTMIGDTIIGRTPGKCNIVLDDSIISGQHARIFRDPHDRWTVMDLGSKNGTWVDGERVEQRAVLPGQAIMIGPFQLAVSDASAMLVEPFHDKFKASDSTREDAGVDVTLADSDSAQRLTQESLKQLNELTERLTRIVSPAQVYPFVCEELQDSSKMSVLVLRIPVGKVADGDKIEFLAWACHGRSGKAQDSGHPMPRLSERVLGALSENKQAVMASNSKFPDVDLDLTVNTTGEDRAVICAPVHEASNAMDAIYLDMPVDMVSPAKFDFVQAVARQVGLAIKSLQLGKLRTEYRVIDEQLEMAREIQDRLTCAMAEKSTMEDLYVHYKPAMHIGGDYCDYWRLTDDRLAFAVGDVAGKGLHAALVMATVHAALRAGESASPVPRPADLMNDLNRYLSAHLPDGLFVTMFLGILDSTSGVVEYVNAGHLPPLILGSSGVRVMETGRNPVLGISGREYDTAEIQLESDSGMLLYTDGVTEGKSPVGDLFGAEALYRVASENCGCTAMTIVEAVVNAIDDYCHPIGPQDDLTVMALLRARSKD